MKASSSIKKIGSKPRGTFCAIGIFDGVHKGHRRIIETMVAVARSRKTESLVVTFDPHPITVLDARLNPATLISLEHRIRLIHDLGVDQVIVMRFNSAFAAMGPEDFVRNFLVEMLNVKRVFVGCDFRFGKNGSGDVALLRSLGGRFGYAVTVVRPVLFRKKPISSTLIRSAIARGDLATAARALGRPVSLFGEVVRGSRRGRAFGYPTANIDPHHEAIPPRGVYAVMAKIGDVMVRGMLNIGTQPTFSSRKRQVIEAHFFDFRKNIYGKMIEIYFLRRIRDEKRFSGADGLARQLRKDEARSRSAFGGSFFLPRYIFHDTISRQL